MPLHEQLCRRQTFTFHRELMRSQWWTLNQLRELQLTKLRKLIDTALNCTAGYAKLAGVDRTFQPDTLDDLSLLPLLDKATISAHRESLVNHNVPGGPIRYNTGGSSGEPLIFYFDKRRQAYDKAARMRTHGWWGIHRGDREAYIWGSPIELSKQDRLKNVRDWLMNEMLLSAFELSEQRIGWFVERLRRFRPRCLFGYPSSIALLCQLGKRAGYNLRSLPIEVVFSTAEVLYGYQRDTISEAFGGVPVVNGYGSREGGFIAHECPEGQMHITSENVIVEFIKNGQVVESGQDGEIVVTHLDNYAMPFIRYRTGDIGQSSVQKCPCGRGLEIMQVVQGRSTDFIVSPDGRWVHGLGLIYMVRNIPGIQKYQIIQEALNKIRVLVVLDETFPADGQLRIRTGINQLLGSGVRVQVEEVPEIPAEPSGKFRFVISRVAQERQALL